MSAIPSTQPRRAYARATPNKRRIRRHDLAISLLLGLVLGASLYSCSAKAQEPTAPKAHCGDKCQMMRKLVHIEAMLTQELSARKIHQDQVDASNKAGDDCYKTYGPWEQDSDPRLNKLRHDCLDAIPKVEHESRYEY